MGGDSAHNKVLQLEPNCLQKDELVEKKEPLKSLLWPLASYAPQVLLIYGTSIFYRLTSEMESDKSLEASSIIKQN